MEVRTVVMASSGSMIKATFVCVIAAAGMFMFI
jgi:hypothetical protein